jgi:high-affinity Fe2+/Pb2+ permease
MPYSLSLGLTAAVVATYFAAIHLKLCELAAIFGALIISLGFALYSIRDRIF